MKERSIGKTLKNERLQLGLTVEEVAFHTRIRKEYIESIEKDNFAKFDSHVYAKGFIKNYAKFLKLDDEALISVYRRDYENTEISRKIKKVSDEEIKESKNKKLKLKDIKFTNRQLGMGLLGIFIIILVIFVLNLINKAFLPPTLNINSPTEASAGDKTIIDYYENNLIIKGETTPYTLIKINEVPVPLKNGFQFESDPLPITSDKNTFNISATNQLGVVSKITLEVNKKEKPNANVEGIVGTVTVIGDRASLTIKGDGNVIFQGSAFNNDAFPVITKKTLEIQSSNPELVKVYINNKEFRLTRKLETFEVVNNVLVQR